MTTFVGYRYTQVRKEAEQMLTNAIESRSREDLSAAVALATQLRLRSPQVRRAPGKWWTKEAKRTLFFSCVRSHLVDRVRPLYNVARRQQSAFYSIQPVG